MTELTVSVLPRIDAIPAGDWDGCGDGGDPFTTHRFLLALEQSGSVGGRTGWHPSHLVARVDGAVAGVSPVYLKTHSQGEYIFDHAWADAWARAGGQYYPKLQCAVPFTPATGPRLIARDPAVQALEDVACFAFIRHYLGGFAPTQEPDALLRIVQKTARKMSPEARARALVEFPMPDALAEAFREDAR